MVAWLAAAPTARKVALFMAGALLTLVFDVVVAHVLGRRDVKWTQAVPIVYGVVGAVALVAAVFGLPAAAFHRWTRLVGWAGVAVGVVGAALHTAAIVGGLAGATVTLDDVTRELSVGPPLFAPLAFTGVGLVLVTLRRAPE